MTNSNDTDRLRSELEKLTFNSKQTENIMQLILADREKAAVEARSMLIDSLIDDERACYEIYGEDKNLCVGVKLMADRVREKYDVIQSN